MKQRSLLTTQAKPGCKVCRTVRPFLIVAVSLIALLWSRPDWRLPDGFDYSTIVGDVFALVCVLYVVWRVVDHLKHRPADESAEPLDVPVRRARRRNRVAGDPRGWK
jgi:hypothetical protein